MQKIILELTESQYMRLQKLVDAREKFRTEIGEPAYWTVERIAEQGVAEHIIHLERMYGKELGRPGKIS